MISAGNDITALNDRLVKIDVKHLYDALRTPKAQVEAKIRQLRAVRQLDQSQYAKMKLRLPYFTCAIFSPPIRKTENFAYTEHFVLDIDHISEKDIDIEVLKSKLAMDSRVLLLFTSPSGDGLKVMFRLHERCYESAVYKVFYRAFASRFSQQYNLGQTMDTRTCDVTRACFVSDDRSAFYRPECETINLKDYINADEDIGHALEIQRRNEDCDKAAAAHDKAEYGQHIDDAVLDFIRQTLNPNTKMRRRNAAAYVPEKLEGIMSDLRLFIADKGIETTDEVNINYGKKLRFRLGARQAEINIFYGKRGFSVVQSPRTGTDSGMNALMADVIEEFLYERG